MVSIKSPAEIKLMRQAGKIAAKAFKALIKYARPGRNTLELDQLAESIIRKYGARPAFKWYQMILWKKNEILQSETKS